MNINNLKFNDIFDLNDLQRLQDLFADAHGVASLITHPDGTPITKPSNFTELCNNIIRKTEKGCANCYKSDALIGSHNHAGPIVQKCLSGGLLEAGASISVEGKHIANWLIGQVLSEGQDREQMLLYADEIGANREDFAKALKEVTQMPVEKFKKVADLLFAFANELSDKAYNSILVKKQVEQHEKTKGQFHSLFENMIEGSALHEIKYNDEGVPIDYVIIDTNHSFEKQLGITKESIIGKTSREAYGVSDPPYFDIYKEVVLKGKPKVFDTYFPPLGKHFSISAYPTHKSGFATIFEDITEIKSNEKIVTNNNERLQSIVKILQHEAYHLQDFLDYALDELIKLTESKIGYIYFYNEEKREFVLNTWSKDVMKECAVAKPSSVYCLDNTGLWGEAVRQKKPIINNNYEIYHPDKRGYPQGHVHLKKFLTIPVFFNKKIVAVAGVANKESDYDQTDILQMTLLMDAVWKTTERIKSDKTLKESLTKYKLLFNLFPVGITVSDSEGKIVETNSISEKLLGISEEEQKRRQISGEEWHIVRPDGTPMPSSEFPSVLALKEGKHISNIEMGIVKSKNEICWINVSAAPVLLQGFGVVVAYNDITERKKSEKTLEETNAYLENLLNYANAPIIVWNPQFRITRFNHAFENLTGLQEKDVIGKSLDILFPVEKIEESMNLIQKTESGERWETVQIQIQNKDTSIKTVLWNSATLFAADGITPTATIAQGQDITKRNKAEQEIIQKNIELEKLNSEKDKFFSIIAHDLKSPFNSIVGFSELLEGQIKEKDLKGIRKYSEIIRKSSNRAMDLLMNLMEWAQSQTGRMEFNPQYLEMVDLIKEVEALFADIARQKSVTISRTLPQHAPVYADKAMISTIMRNLISNAVKFSKPGGKIKISVEENENRLTVKVTDMGVGISKERQEKLFRMDENNSTPGTMNEKGTGLGLILCKEFVEKHGGQIWVESELGKGSAFCFILPNLDKQEGFSNENY